jgi:hypothetical protein
MVGGAPESGGGAPESGGGAPESGFIPTDELHAKENTNRLPSHTFTHIRKSSVEVSLRITGIL